jgi:hypothetical protein
VAVARALNRAIASANTVMVRAVAEDMGLKQADVRKQIIVRRAVADAVLTRMLASLEARGARLPLIAFKARAGRGGVRARLPGGAGHYPRAFIATMPSGHVGVFQRKAAPRLPIVELHGPSIPKVFERHTPAGVARGQEQLVKNLVHELRFAIQQSAA